MKSFGGYNVRVDPADLDEGLSPDCANVCAYKDIVGLLGPRLGVTAVNTTAFPSRVTGLIPLTLPASGSVAGSTNWLVATADGEIFDVNAPANTFPSAPTSNFVGGNEVFAFGTDSVDLTYPDTSIEVARNSISVNLALTRYAKIGAAVQFFTSTAAVMDWELDVGALINGTVVYMAHFKGTGGGSSGTFTPLVNVGSQFGGVGVGHPGKGTATAVAVKLRIPNGWAAGAAGGDFIRAAIL